MGLRAAPAAEGDAYASQGDCEVALAIPESETSRARLQFEREPARLAYAVTGNTASVQLKSRVYTPEGDEKDLPPIVLEQGKTNTGFLDFGVFPEKRLGVFRVEVWVERDGKRISPYNEAVVTRVRQPRYWKKDAPRSHFGTQVGADPLGILEAKAIGINWVRCHGPALHLTAWAYLEPAKGQWTFPDAAVKRFREGHLSILGQLGTAPIWASYRREVTPPQGTLGPSDIWFQPKKVEEWSSYVKKVVAHYQGQIHTYDVWNDPMSARTFAISWRKQLSPAANSFLTSPFPQKDYANLLLSTSKAVKEANLKARLLGINAQAQVEAAVGRFGAAEWANGVLDFGGWKPLDVIGYHDFNSGGAGFPGDSVERGHKRVTGRLQERFPSEKKPVWMTESNPARGNAADGFYHRTLPYGGRSNPVAMADETCRFAVSALSQGVEKIFLSSMEPSSSPFLPNRETEPGSLITADGYPNPSAAALSTLAWNVDALTFERRVEPAPGVFAYIFRSFGTVTAVIALKLGDKTDYRIPGGFRVKGTGLFGNPVAKGAPFGPQVVYVSAPGWLIDMEAVLSGRSWIFRRWLFLGAPAAIVLFAALVWTLRRRLTRKSSVV